MNSMKLIQFQSPVVVHAVSLEHLLALVLLLKLLLTFPTETSWKRWRFYIYMEWTASEGRLKLHSKIQNSFRLRLQ